ncbi:DEAD/DEAH box helicase [Clostridium magnum]|uniref:ATP-dependent helicase/deoxyribonuclease subunit B n=1 Tax=Clostridium magnum DSM 2767 TaxID=1121326 RepID=A0A162QJM5_9CLOT|nr:3'-5' exonuclease [Clostridium magnum]KZL88607.1 ATP-dependent helicase/deoxyribonuclease subunit B [Clostridium magnum DSM 2767]SHI84691.1 Nuclease-related domain-containing protein [Clostridium magnum DSM 2767]
MAVMIPESISALDSATAGEKRLFKILKSNLPSDYTVWYDLRVNGRYPDFIILGPDLGSVVLEVKDWALSSIESADTVSYTLNTLGVKTNPLKQARTYMFNMVDELKKDSKLLQNKDEYRNNLCFNFGCGVVFSKINRRTFESSPFANTIDEKCIMFSDDLKELEYSIDKIKLQSMLRDMIPVKFDFGRMSEQITDRIRGNLFKEVKLSTDSEAVFKVMNLNQEGYAKGLGYGHRVIRGVAGSGKTVILICRAKYLAEIHKDWNILVLCYNKTLANFLKTSIVDDKLKNVEVIHFHGWINKIFNSLKLRSGLFRDKEISENISSISDSMLNSVSKYDAILIDEGQDLERDWLAFVVKMLRNPEHSHLMLTSDGAQNLYSRKYTLKSVGIKAAGRTIIMRENYRNTKEILSFAHTFLSDGLLKDNINEEDNNYIVEPDNSLREGRQPDLMYCQDFHEEINKIAMNIIRLKESGIDYGDMCVAYVHSSYKNTNYLNIIEEIFKNRGIPYFVISKSGNTKARFKLDSGTVNISTIHSIKGLDFKHVFICGINDRLSESMEEAKKLLYVGMTRARDGLMVTYSIDNDIVGDLIKAKIKTNSVNSEDARELVAATKDDVVERKNEGGLLSKLMGLFGR